MSDQPMTSPPTPTVEPGTWAGGEGSPRAFCVLAENSSPMTLEGTNTWILAELDAQACVVLDPGPADETHLRRVADVVTERGQRVEAVLLTHRHLDHAEGAARFAELTGAPVRAQGPNDLADGDVITAGDLEIAVLSTPGHTSDSLCFYIGADEALLTGDTILGWGTTMVAYPDGRLADYLTALGRIAALTGSGAVRRFLPGHGATLLDADASVQYYLAHRAERLEQVRRALRDGASDADSVVEVVYADVPRELWPAATQSVNAQLEYLRGG